MMGRDREDKKQLDYIHLVFHIASPLLHSSSGSSSVQHAINSVLYSSSYILAMRYYSYQLYDIGMLLTCKFPASLFSFFLASILFFLQAWWLFYFIFVSWA
jgi:hypothetical protein